MSELTRWRDIYKALDDAGVDTYSPGQHKGECLSKYAVVKQDGSTAAYEFSSSVMYYKILCYCPQNEYSTLETFLSTVKQAMKALEPMIMYAQQQDAPYYDEDVKGWMVAIRYRNYIKL